jgi:hypothetical protein
MWKQTDRQNHWRLEVRGRLGSERRSESNPIVSEEVGNLLRASVVDYQRQFWPSLGHLDQQPVYGVRVSQVALDRGHAVAQLSQDFLELLLITTNDNDLARAAGK